ncbi:MAG: hypothetical protein HYY97_16015 [Rhodocyclales bacterium]|nr:hypothetical protein [Rhodocyclales bacterium]
MNRSLIKAADEDVTAAEANLLDVLKRECPEGALVKVSHHRGEFFARVLWHKRAGYIAVRNIRSGKKSDRYWSDIEVVAEGQK